MKTLARVIELALVIGSVAYSGAVTLKWVRAEKRASWLEGQWSVYESLAASAEDPKKLKKW